MNLDDLDFGNAILVGADLGHADLRGTNLIGVNLDWAILHGANFENAVFDDETVWPADFEPFAAGAIFTPQIMLRMNL